ncbi:hypothetical protein D3C72_1657810 [compost metagenome]
MVQVHVQHRFPGERAIDALLLESDEEGALGCRPWQVGGIPATVLQEQVLVLLEPQQGHRLPVTGGGVLAKKEGIFALQLGKRAGVGRHHAHRIAKLGPEAGGHPEVAVGDVVEHFVTRHGVVQSHQQP